jgi:hypothetical protein
MTIVWNESFVCYCWQQSNMIVTNCTSSSIIRRIEIMPFGLRLRLHVPTIIFSKWKKSIPYVSRLFSMFVNGEISWHMYEYVTWLVFRKQLNDDIDMNYVHESKSILLGLFQIERSQENDLEHSHDETVLDDVRNLHDTAAQWQTKQSTLTRLILTRRSVRSIDCWSKDE